jgi:hypothetical protein
MKTLFKFLFIIILFFVWSCKSEIEQCGQHYQKHNDYLSLKKVVELMPLSADTLYVKKILGNPINMGFDFRYLVDSTSPNRCPVGAVFHIDAQGKTDQQWMGEICE